MKPTLIIRPPSLCVLLVYSIIAAHGAGTFGTEYDGARPLARHEIAEPSALHGQREDRRLIRLVRPYFRGDVSTLERRLLGDARDGRWDHYSLLTAALLASGVDDVKRLRDYEDRLSKWTDELRGSGSVQGAPRAQAEAIFEFMHEKILRGGYEFDCTNLALAIDEGRFNCVTTTILFNYMAEQFGLVAFGLEFPGHVKTRVPLPDGPLDVETTCPSWFRMSPNTVRRPQRIDATIGCPVAHDKTCGQARKVSQVELVAMIYFNQGVDLLAEKRFVEAAAANAKAVCLNPSSPAAWGNLLATLNNWAIHLAGQHRYAEAARVLERGLSLGPGFEPFKANYVHVHHRWLDELCRAGEFEEAVEVLAKAEKHMAGEPYFLQARLQIYRRWDPAAHQTKEVMHDDRPFIANLTGSDP